MVMLATEAEVVVKSRVGSEASRTTWRLAANIMETALRAEGFKGTFHLMGIDKVTWRGQHNPPWKVNRLEGNNVILVIKPPKRGEGECWQYGLQCPGPIAADVEARLRRAAHPEEEQEEGNLETYVEESFDKLATPPSANVNGHTNGHVVEQPTPEPTPASDDVATRLIERINRLSAITQRTKKRQERLSNVKVKQDELQRELDAIKAKIDEYELAEMMILDEEKADTEAIQAAEALRSLESLISG